MDDPNKREALSPEMQALVNGIVSSAVKEAISGVFTSMGPVLQSIALTPEKMAEAERLRRAPDPASIAREARERKMMKDDVDRAREDTNKRQRDCPGPHKDKNGRWAVSLIHNYPDRQVRGVCTHCHLLIEPRHWEIGAPTPEFPRGKPHEEREHPLYHIVKEVEAQGSM